MADYAGMIASRPGDGGGGGGGGGMGGGGSGKGGGAKRGPKGKDKGADSEYPVAQSVDAVDEVLYMTDIPVERYLPELLNDLRRRMRLDLLPGGAHCPCIETFAEHARTFFLNARCMSHTAMARGYLTVTVGEGFAVFSFFFQA